MKPDKPKRKDTSWNMIHMDIVTSLGGTCANIRGSFDKKGVKFIRNWCNYLLHNNLVK